MRKSTEAAKALLEDMTCKNYHWSSERATPKRRAGRYEVDVVTLLANRMDALAQRLDKVGTRSIPGSSLGSPRRVYAFCETCGVQGHTSVECYNVPSTIEHTNALHSFNPSP